jgi:hypothetical protein
MLRCVTGGLAGVFWVKDRLTVDRDQRYWEMWEEHDD